MRTRIFQKHNHHVNIPAWFETLRQSPRKEPEFFFHEPNTGRNITKNRPPGNVRICTYCTNDNNIDPDLRFRILVQGSLRKRVLACYYEVIKHPGESRMYSSNSQYLTWPSIKVYVEIWAKKYPKYEKIDKTTNRPYGNITFCKPKVLLCITNNFELVPPWTVFFKTYDGTKIKKNIS